MNDEQKIIPTFEFTEDPLFNVENVKIKNLLPNNQCQVLYNLFTKNECEQLIKCAEEYGFFELPNDVQNYRNNQRIINHNEKLKNVMFKRIKKHVDNEITITNKCPTIATNFYTSGKWQLDDLNDNFRLCKYNPSNYFKKHYDEGFHPNIKNHRSFKTCMLYLNEHFEGGETIFYFDELKHMFSFDKNETTITLKPSMGMCIIFNQHILHEGATVLSGLKYFIRTDIFYKKIESHIAENLTENQKTSLEYYEKGINCEKNSLHDQAIKYYKIANKIYDKIDELYGSMYN